MIYNYLFLIKVNFFHLSKQGLVFLNWP